MVKIRLSRLGSRGKVFYRIVAVDEQRKRSGEFLEILGFWHPKNKTTEVQKERIKFWLDKGAVLTKAAEKIIK